MRWKLFTLMLLAWPLAFAGPVYKWVDESGVVHYSDQPHENAQLIHLGTPQTYKATNYADPAAAAGAAQQLSYKCAVTSPADQQTFVNVDTIGVGARVDPPPSEDAQMFVMLDGVMVMGQPTSGAQFTLKNVDRGEHNVSIVMRNAAGKVACQSPAVTFFVRLPSVNAPANPNNPANQPPSTGQPPAPGTPTAPGVPPPPRPLRPH
ncbi:MAG TPA: DUF4124 domain-containing protein [Steroidobacteraceae bacterium]|jgi:hypothetical protein|nr:DUF4124 domain-containing protein [Steroidobacteraceae bacterium]